MYEAKVIADKTQPVTIIYPLLRPLLAAFCVSVAIRLRSMYFAVSALALIIPSPSTPDHWRYRWLPFEVIRFLLAIGLSLRLLSTGRIPPAERRFIVCFGFSVGLMLAAAGWLWIPENWFQAVVTVRQYLYVLLTSIVVSMWARLWVRPATLPLLFGCWCWWLLFTTISATAGKGGIFWNLTPWREGMKAWVWVGCLDVAGKCLVCAVFLLAFNPRQAES